MENKKEYILNRWYPTLPNDWKTEHDYVYYKEESLMINKLLMTTHIINFKHLEYRDFWEEVKQPLFVTDDGVEVFDQEDVYYVTDKLEKINSFINWFTIESMAKDVKIFKHESNADEYIWRNKRVFSYQDMMKAKHSIILADEDIEKAAKERVCNG